LVRLSADGLAYSPNVVILDHANDSTAATCKNGIEGYIRRVWTANPSTQMIIIGSPAWALGDIGTDANVLHPANETTLGDVKALAAYYGIPYVDFWDWCKSVVPGTYHLNEVTADGAHPSAVGYAQIAELMKPFLPVNGGTQPLPLPARLYDNGDYENTPTRTLGTGYDSRTGVWSDTGTRTESSEVGATITFSATCQSYGCYRADAGSNDVQVSIDGGAYAAANFYQNGAPIAGARAAHTIAIKVVSGTVRIDEFWAV